MKSCPRSNDRAYRDRLIYERIAEEEVAVYLNAISRNHFERKTLLSTGEFIH
jgi:hypothetical protein